MLSMVSLLRNIIFAIFLFGLQFVSGYVRNKGSITLRNASIDHRYLGNVSRDREEIWFFTYNKTHENQSVKVTVLSEHATQNFPVLFVARLQRGVLSWPVPFIAEASYMYNTVSRILCHNLKATHSPSFFIEVASSSPVLVQYKLQAAFVKNFNLILNKARSISVAPAQPEYRLFTFPESVDSVRVTAESDSKICAILSIQGTECPVYDLARNVEFTGTYQTMTTKAAITVQRRALKSPQQFYIVLIVKSSDDECTLGKHSFHPLSQYESSNEEMLTGTTVPGRTKSVTVTVHRMKTVDEHVPAILFPVFFFGSFYVVAFFFLVGVWIKQKRTGDPSLMSVLMPKNTVTDDDGELRTPFSNREGNRKHYGSTLSDVDEVENDTSINTTEAIQRVSREDTRSFSETELLQSVPEHPNVTDGSSSDRTLHEAEDYDMLHEIEHEKDIYRLRTNLMLTDMAKKGRKYWKKKYKLYHWNLVTIAIFYALPVIQLVITYQQVLNVSGDEDICYYNFFCASPASVLSAFNNVYSNIGYVMLGFLFFLLVMRRDRLHKQAVAANSQLEKHYGIPQHYAIFYAMAIALMMEGILSACYHVCPNNSNFQFDTSFMYIITCLSIVRLYQTRHPDITANAHTVYACFALIILVAVFGVVFSSLAFWATFCVLHIIACLYLSSQMYYMGRVKKLIDAGIFTRFLVFLRYDCFACPTYKDRMLLLLIANAVNWVFAIYGVVNLPKDFATYLLAILIVNGLLYVGFYVIMKLRNKERIEVLPSILVILTLVFWIAALVFFMKRLTTWQKTPAQSREGNKACIWFEFYDDHDVWHFLSACAIFFSFLALLTLDDDLQVTPRNKIPVF